MISTPISKYYHFGRIFRFLLDAKEGYRVGKKDGSWILANIIWFFDELNDLGLKVTSLAQPTIELKSFKEDLSQKEDSILSNEEAAKLHQLMSNIEIVLNAEITGLKAFVVTPKRIDVQKLLYDVPSLFAPNLFIKLPSIAKHDLNEAGKCITFELPTAAAFYLLRGTESVLREFYCKLILRNRINNLLWGNIIQDLINRPKAKPYNDLLHHLDHIKNAFRNPTQHPEKIYDIQEAQDLWSLCVDSINRMAKIF